MLGGSLGLAAAAACSSSASQAPLPQLWRAARNRGLAYGSSAATWELSDAAYAQLFRRQASVLLTEDDLLWYRVRPTPQSPLNFARPDRIVDFATAARQSVLGAHLVWDQGFGPGWTHHDLWQQPTARARRLLYGTVHALVRRYRGRIPVWSVVNEAVAASGESNVGGLRTDVPWFHTCGPDYVEQAFHVAHAADPHAVLLLNDNGFETVDPYGNDPAVKRRAALTVLDTLLARGVPVHAFGLQAHLYARDFAQRFDTSAYARFLREIAHRGMQLLITELDVLDDGLPATVSTRDGAVADVYRRYLDCALAEPAVTTVLTFGLSDRYTWLQQDYPRRDGAGRRPLPFDGALHPTPAFDALLDALQAAPKRRPGVLARY